jgi:hypothetical protein
MPGEVSSAAELGELLDVLRRRGWSAHEIELRVIPYVPATTKIEALQRQSTVTLQQPSWNQSEGVPLTPGQTSLPRPPASLTAKVDEIRKVGFWVALLVSLGSTSLNALVLSALNPGKLDMEGAQQFWQIFWLTTPLCITVVALALIVPQPWFGGFFGLFVAAGVVLGGAWLGSQLAGVAGPPPAPVIDTTGVSGPQMAIGVIVNATVGYLDAYGVWLFIQSYAVGAFIAYALYRLGSD